MATESAKQVIASELRDLRKLPGALNLGKMTHAAAILKGFGGDDPDVALTRLTDLAREYEDDREIQAAMASIGWDVESVSVLDRLTEYAERQFVDARTVRRWSDAGIRKLTLIILGKAPWIQPRLRQVVVVEDDLVKIGIDARIPSNLRMETPHLWVGDREIEIRMSPIVRSPEPQHLQTGLDELAPLSDLPIDIRVQWFGEKSPLYESVTSSRNGDVYFSSRIVFLEMKTSVRFRKTKAQRPQSGIDESSDM